MLTLLVVAVLSVGGTLFVKKHYDINVTKK